MKIRYDPLLVEQVVHLLARADSDRWLAYREVIDPLYDAAERNRRFAEETRALFFRWKAAQPCEEALELARGVENALVARSRRHGDEGADLHVNDERTVVLRVVAERFTDADGLRVFLRHEMRHVADMLDPRFDYRPDLRVEGRTRAELELVRGRYQVLWNHAIDQVETSPISPDARRDEFDRAFVALDERQRARLAERFLNPVMRTHEALLAAARDPWTFLGEQRTRGALPGQPCPLCGFPTYDWAEDPPVDAIIRDYPDWKPADGACRQCCGLLAGAGRKPAGQTTRERE